MMRKPFSPDELEIIGYFPADMGHGKPSAKFKTPVTAKENYDLLLKREIPWWLPNQDMVTFCPAMIPDNVARWGVVEAEPCEERGGKDMFGVEWVFVEEAGGSMVKPGHPLLSDASEWREKIVFPDIESWDWEGTAARKREFLNSPDAPVFMVHYNGLFERLITFMDFEGAAVALIDEDQKKDVKALFEALTDLYIDLIDHEIRYFGLNGILFHDDWGSQRAPFFSIETYREMILPYIRKLTGYCHSRNILFELHSCGSNGPLVPAIAESGIDMWRPQPMNDIDGIYREYGDRFFLGVRSPMFRPGTPDEEKIASAKKLVERYGLPGKYVYTSTHSADPVYRKALYQASRELYYRQASEKRGGMSMVPEWIKALVEQLFYDESFLSEDPELYNRHVAELPTSTSISSSGIAAVGAEAVRAMSSGVGRHSTEGPKKPEQKAPRKTEYLSYAESGDIVYVVVRSGADPDHGMGWVMTLIFRRIDGEWKLLHRQSTRLKA